MDKYTPASFSHRSLERTHAKFGGGVNRRRVECEARAYGSFKFFGAHDGVEEREAVGSSERSLISFNRSEQSGISPLKKVTIKHQFDSRAKFEERDE